MEVRVTPRATRNIVDGIRDGRVRVRVTAPPADGAANSAVIAVVADALDVPKRAVPVVAGVTARYKVLDESDGSKCSTLAVTVADSAGA